jgi:hypothetical protein
MSKAHRRRIDRRYARQVAAAVVDALTRPRGPGHPAAVEVNDRQWAELLVAAAVLQVVRGVRKWGF